MAQILQTRDFETLDEIHQYWTPRLEFLHEPQLLEDMGKASERLVQAIRRREKIVIWGDYDVDGATSVSLLMRFLSHVGAQVDFHIPNRLRDGYGLNLSGLEKISQSGAQVVVTVDNGITALEQAKEARRLGLDLIITDHHEPGDEIPEAFAVVDPKRSDCFYPDQRLAGVGVAFKLACAVARSLGGGKDLDQDMKHFLLQSLALVALGTVADLVPLTGENRILVGYGLHQLEISSWPGLQALIEISNCRSPLSATDVAFKLGPRINAAGRLEDADLGVRLMTTNDVQEAKVLAQQLDQSNIRRREIEKDHTKLALEKVQDNFQDTQKAVVVSGEGWHPGVIGIVASRLVENYHRPVIVVAFEGDRGKASCRSISGFDMHDMLQQLNHFFVSFGGHAMAAGFTILRKDFEAFVEAFQNLALEKLNQPLQPSLLIDAWIPLKAVDENLLKEINHLAPFGINNHRPLLAAQKISITKISRLGRDGSHLSFNSVAPQASFRSIAYGAGDSISYLNRDSQWDLAFEPRWNTWGGNRHIELSIKAIRPSVSDS